MQTTEVKKISGARCRSKLLFWNPQNYLVSLLEVDTFPFAFALTNSFWCWIPKAKERTELFFFWPALIFASAWALQMSENFSTINYGLPGCRCAAVIFIWTSLVFPPPGYCVTELRSLIEVADVLIPLLPGYARSTDTVGGPPPLKGKGERNISHILNI